MKEITDFLDLIKPKNDREMFSALIYLALRRYRISCERLLRANDF